MKLKLGKMTSKEIAEWFGIAYNSFRRSKSKRLEELKTYCDFEEVYGGVNILTIFNDTYVKNSNKIREIYAKGFEELKNPIDTVSNINEKIYDKYHNELTTLKTSDSGYHYAIEVRNANYGIPFKSQGIKGICYYLWCKVELREDGIYYIQLNEKEEEIKQKLLKKYFGTDVEKDLLIAEMVEMKEISKEEAYDLMIEYRNLNNKGFVGFLKELEKEIGEKIVKATKFENVIYFDERDKPKELDSFKQKEEI